MIYLNNAVTLICSIARDKELTTCLARFSFKKILHGCQSCFVFLFDCSSMVQFTFGSVSLRQLTMNKTSPTASTTANRAG